MSPIHGCPENFRVPEYPTATFAEIFNGLLFRWILWMCVQNLKFVALPIAEIIGGTEKIWAVPGYAHALFPLKFLMGFCSDRPRECICQIWSSYHLPYQSVVLSCAQNPLDTFSRNFPQTGKLPTCCWLLSDTANKSATSWQQVVVMEFGKRRDTTDTTDFRPRQLVTGKLV